MDKKIKLSIIYVYYNTPNELVRSIGSINKATNISNYEVIIVDNNSPKKLPNITKKHNFRVIKNLNNLGFGKGCNLGAKKSRGEFLLFVNPDTIFKNDSINRLIEVLEKDKNIGVVGPKMVNSMGKTLPTTSNFITPVNSLIKFSKLGKKFTKNNVKSGQTDVLSGACMMIRKKVFEKVNGFDERFFMYFEEQDLCKRIVDHGYKVYYQPKSQIVHHIGRSLQDKDKIKKYFQKSRFEYMRKHFGVLNAIWTESVLRLITLSNIGLLFIFVLSLWINTYKMNELMLFIGDSARDFIEAYKMASGSSFPLVGIPSSVIWLHQGAISIWLIGSVFMLFGPNPIIPGYLFGFFGAISSTILFKLGSEYFDKKTGFLGALLFATAPMIVVNSRMPYHTSIVPLFSIIFFLVLLYVIRQKKYLPIVFFLYGLLLQVELSNVIVLLIIVILIYYSRYKITISTAVKSVIGFLLGIAPFVLYDIINGPSYILFPIWILNRVRLVSQRFLFGEENLAFTSLGLVYQQIASSIFPYAPNFIILIFITSLIILLIDFIRKRQLPTLIVLLWLIIPLTSFLLHGSPGTAYFSLIYPAVSIAVAYGVIKIFNKKILASIFVVAIALLNIIMLIRNDFYVTSYRGSNPMPPNSYYFGQTYKFSEKIVNEILNDANKKNFALSGAGSLKMFKTSMDTYKFFILQKGGSIDSQSNLKYTVYVEKELLKGDENIIYKGIEGYIVKE